MKTIKKLFSASILIVLVFAVLTLPETTQAQQVNKIFDEIGGGGSSSSGDQESGSSNTMYIVGGIIIVGVILYSVLKEKKEPPKSDTTSVIVNDSYLSFMNEQESVDSRDKSLPIDFFGGVQNELIFREEKKYFIGVSFNF